MQLGNTCLNSLSWADDLVLMSRSAEGLQNCLNKLESYCSKWGLKVNKEKTKCMTMCQGMCIKPRLTFGNCMLENVDSYKYLGMIITYNGNLKKMIDDRMNKAKRAIFMLKRALSTSHNVSVKLAMSIFDKQIAPILLYGCPLWGVTESSYHVKIKLSDVTIRNTRRTVKDIFQQIGADIKDRDIVLTRLYREKQEICVRLRNVSNRNEIMRKYNLSPLTVMITNYSPRQTSTYEKVHTNFSKFALGISKYGVILLCQQNWGDTQLR